VVVFGPEILAMSPDGRVTVTGGGPLEAHAARPADAQAWLNSHGATFVTGLPEWEVLSTRTADRLETPDANAGTSPSPSTSPSPGASPQPDADTDADADAAADEASNGENVDAAIPPTSADHWRATWKGDGRVSVAIADIPAGMPLVVRSADGAPLSEAIMTIDRELNEDWIAPLIWWGAVLAAIGVAALIFLIVDLRPLQAHGETWLARRKRIGSGDAAPQPGSRRERRMQKETTLVADLDPDDVRNDDAPDDESEDRS
jgi:hypothetical protein